MCEHQHLRSLCLQTAVLIVLDTLQDFIRGKVFFVFFHFLRRLLLIVCPFVAGNRGLPRTFARFCTVIEKEKEKRDPLFAGPHTCTTHTYTHTHTHTHTQTQVDNTVKHHSVDTVISNSCNIRHPIRRKEKRDPLFGFGSTHLWCFH